MACSAGTIQEAVHIIVDTLHPSRVILFRSAAWDDMGQDSDLDFLIVVPEGTHPRHAAQAIYRNIIGLALPVDIVVATEQDLAQYGSNPSLVFKRALADGRTLYAA